MAYNTAEEILIGENKNNGSDPNWQVLTKFPEPLTFDRDLNLTFSPDGSLLASYDPDDHKRVWNLKTMKSIELENPVSTPHVYISQFLFSPDRSLLFGVQEAKTYEPSSLYLWDTHTGKLVRYWTAQIYQYAFHPTQPLFVGADYMSGMIRFFDLRTGDLVKELHASQYIQRMAFSPDGNLLVLGYDSTRSDEGRIEIRDTQTLDLLYEIPKAGNRFAFSPDGTMLAVGLNDGRIEYWEMTVK
jgi:WD40 repeat protein